MGILPTPFVAAPPSITSQECRTGHGTVGPDQLCRDGRITNLNSQGKCSPYFSPSSTHIASKMLIWGTQNQPKM